MLAHRILLAAAVLLLAFCAPAGAAGTRQRPVYLFTSFRGNGADGLHLAYSHDGYRWTDLGKVFLRPTIGKSKLMRDPCIARAPDGTFHMVWTTGWWEKGFGHAHSKDLIHWSDQQYVPAMAHEPKARNVWAPELFYDQPNRRYLILWATTIPGRFPDTDGGRHHNHRMYYTATKEFESFTKARLLFDPGFNVIDATIVRHAGRHVLVLKDERIGKKVLRMAFSPNAEGPYQSLTDPFTIDWVEGPSVLEVGDEWLVYFDHYHRPHYYGAVKTRDFKTWTDVSKQMAFPRGHRHGTALPISQQILDGLKKHAAAGQ